jgi:hypothetical protein
LPARGRLSKNLQEGTIFMITRYIAASLCCLFILLGCSKDDTSPTGNTKPPTTYSYAFIPTVVFHGAIPDTGSMYAQATTNVANVMNGLVMTQAGLFAAFPLTHTGNSWYYSFKSIWTYTYSATQDTTGYTWWAKRDLITFISGHTSTDGKNGYWYWYDPDNGVKVGYFTFTKTAGDTLTGSFTSYVNDAGNAQDDRMDIANYPDKSGDIQIWDATKWTNTFTWAANGYGSWWEYPSTTGHWW